MVPPRLTDEQRMIIDLAADLAENEFSHHAFDWEADTPWSNLEVLADHALLGVGLPAAYGGGEWTHGSHCW